MADTPQQRTDDPEEDLGTTPPAPQGRTDQEQDTDNARDHTEAERRIDDPERSTTDDADDTVE